MKSLPWYNKTEKALTTVWPIELAAGAALITITAILMLSGKRTILAAWLVYMYMP